MDHENTQFQLGAAISSLPLIMTADVKQTLDVIGPWLHDETLQPFLLVGPQGCGKRCDAINAVIADTLKIYVRVARDKLSLTFCFVHEQERVCQDPFKNLPWLFVSQYKY
jgi:hypothetical protein